MKDRREYGRRFFRGWVLTLLWAVLSAGILMNAYGSHRNFSDSITAIFNEEQVLNVHLLQRMLLDHVDEATQTLDHAVSMLRHAPPEKRNFARSAGMVYEDHTDDFLSVSVVSPLGELLYHSRGPEGLNPYSLTAIDKAEFGKAESPVISERIYSPDGEAAALIFVPFRMDQGGEKYFIVGELTLKTFLSTGMRGFEGENISFVVADFMGDIYYIANLTHRKKDLMEHGDIFPLEDACLECHDKGDFIDLAEAVATGGPVHAVFKTPEGRLLNRTASLFNLLNEKWIVSISVPYESLQGQIEKNFNRNVGAAFLLLLLAGSGSLLLYLNNKQRAMEEQYYSIIDSIDVGLCRINDDGRILSSNPAMKRLLGRGDDASLAGEDFDGFCASALRLQQCIDSLQGGILSSDCELEMKRGGGSLFPSLVSAKKVPGSHIDLVVSDISDRKEAENSLMQAKEELERQNEDLKKVDRVKDALISDVSHELKTPVAKQVMNLDILRHIHERTGVGDKTTEVMEAMEANLRRQQNVIKNILLTSRLERGGRKFRFDAVRLDRLVEGVLGDHMHSLAAHGIRVEQNLTEVVVGADEEMLWHVVSNLVDNAIKYRSAESPLISVSMKTKAAEVLLRVEDNGVGLSGKELEKAFERFYQSSTSTEGIGLGLYICLTMLERMGGRINLKSPGRGKGTTAEIRLPLG